MPYNDNLTSNKVVPQLLFILSIKEKQINELFPLSYPVVSK